MAVQQLSNGNPAGVQLGKDATTDKVGFFGTTPVVQPTSSSQAKVTATATTAMSTTLTITSTSPYGFSSSTVGQEIVKSVKEQQVDLAAAITLLNQIRSELVTLGLLKGS